MNLKRYMSLNYKMMSLNNKKPTICVENKSQNLKFPEFNTIKVSTKTFIVMTNMVLI